MPCSQGHGDARCVTRLPFFEFEQARKDCQGQSTRCYLANTSPNQASDGSMESHAHELVIDVNFVQEISR